jgi:hypothetical protein
MEVVSAAGPELLMHIAVFLAAYFISLKYS